MVGYLEEDDEDAPQQEGEAEGGSNGGKEEASEPPEEEDGDKEEGGEERRPSGTAAGGAEKSKTTFRIAGQAVMFMNARGTGLAGDPLVSVFLETEKSSENVKHGTDLLPTLERWDFCGNGTVFRTIRRCVILVRPKRKTYRTTHYMICFEFRTLGLARE